MKRKSVVALKVAVSLGILAFVFSRVDLAQIWTQVNYLSLPFVAFALLYYTGCQWLSCWRWQTVLRATGHFVSISRLLASYFAGMFVSIFLPGSFGGDVYRSYTVSQKIGDIEVAIASVFLERFTGLAAIFALALLGLPLAFKIIGRWDIILLFVVCASVISGGTLLIASPRLLIWAEPWLQKLRMGGIVARIAKIQIILRKFVQHRRAMAIAIAISLLIQLAVPFYQYLLAQQLKISISYLELLIFTPISIVVTLLPISFGGLGVQEGLWVYLFGRVGVSAEQAITLSLTFTLLGWILSLPGSIVLFLDAAGVQKLKQDASK
ncbi:lysylphosphatidylglycerol synthase transmembrane domain-containing protein [Pseudanabaena sp. PCC 6802]|uniref:lysylphosphatidylglycerol synthase transmembrane domain-containing protein n=1 Tax=Pseudanabaena sp. PCC 6802 TaxID=118173 RepID=UPI00034B40A9|nr:lysylphosphatidylglycerol synthase transmembrane domain-containing protein [Pseudanabaena sp. PCC 6802]